MALLKHNLDTLGSTTSSDALGNVETIGGTCQNTNGYTAGSYFVGNDGYFYEATASIAYQATITAGLNCTKTDVGTELTKLNADIDNRPRYISNQVLVNSDISSYTATQDCYVTVSGTNTVYVNSVPIASSTAPFVVSLYVKAGQTVASEGVSRYRVISLL